MPPRTQSVGQHVHANWAFSAAGSYTLTFEVSGTLTSGGAVTIMDAPPWRGRCIGAGPIRTDLLEHSNRADRRSRTRIRQTTATDALSHRRRRTSTSGLDGMTQ
ncbi:TIGR03769 domain-containing protein [Jiangella alba]|uniref:TIGR03769 domain-containing protein n=1 Tax=Jiangella alba TaxID=561176 RepID=UPI003CCBC11A